ncbi:MAG: type II toxin-antitoxin system VapC family toxin [Acidobacteria bacterium]|nr:type II toxin-antitoxin system VapC family toxin [Acidobacteriota bacterium]
MSFWDTSAIVPLCVNEGRSHSARRLWRLFDEHYVWYETAVEIESAFARLERESKLIASASAVARKQLAKAESNWSPVETTSRSIELARNFPRQHGLRALDSLQLAAALVSCNELPKNRNFVSADSRLLKAAEAVGFTVYDIS